VVEGIPEFMAEIVSDAASSEALSREAGLVALGSQDRRKQQSIVRR